MFLATFFLIGCLAIVLLTNNQKAVKQYVPIRIEDEVHRQRNKNNYPHS